MPDLSRTELAVYAACAVLVALIGWRALGADRAASGAPSTARASTTAPAASGAVTVREAPAVEVVVDVTGAVRRAGVYTLRAGQRVQDAIRRAGGASPGAQLEAINLAAKVGDGQQIVVPRRGTGVAPAAGAAGAAAPASGPVNLNSASLEQLDTLDGVGPATAQKILEYRRQNGGFRSVDDLAQVPGIGPKKLAALRTQVQA